jgi:hypothetical protein
MVIMWTRKVPPAHGRSIKLGDVQVSDLGSQFEDLVTHVMRCERWARFEDRLDLAVAVEKAQPIRPAGEVNRELS